jgi:diguanylate cyclase (GGDEF)-like protein/PAS domain S-box-containing protein
MKSRRTSAGAMPLANRRRPVVGRGSVACLVVALTVAFSAHFYARQQLALSEHRALAEKGRSTEMLTNQMISRIDTILASLHSVASATGADPEAFERAAQPTLQSGIFASIRLITPAGEDLISVGQPNLAPPPSVAQQANLREAVQQPGTAWVGRTGLLVPNLAFAHGPGIGRRQALTYVELPILSIPKLLKLTQWEPDRIGDIQLAVYAGEVEQSDSLLFSLAQRLPLEEPRRVVPIQIGNVRWTVVIAPAESLVNDLERTVPWIVLGVGLALGALLGAIVETGRRRRMALHASEERFRLLVHQSSDVITVIDAALVIRDQSPSAERVLGYGPEESIGWPFLDIVHPDDTPAVEAAVRAVLADPDAPLFAACRLRHRAGGWLHIEASGRNLLHEPLVGGVVLNLRDVTERAQAEESRSLLASIVEATSDLVCTIDPDGGVLFLNSAGRTLLGAAPGDAKGETVASFVPGWVAAGVLNEAVATATRDGSWSGEMAVLGADGEEIPVLSVVIGHRDETGALRHFSTITRDIRERKALEDQLAHQAFHDPLTGLPNRLLLADRLQQALRRSERSFDPVAVLLVDLDDFKNVNDSLGHAAGDELLVAAADRLRSCLRSPDTLARLGGDEFAIVVDAAVDDMATVLAERVVQAFERPFRMGEREVIARASVGVAHSTAVTESADDLMRGADVALYAAKTAGKARHALFQPAMLTAALDRLELHTDLRGAAERGEFILDYQPVVELATGSILGVEALVRWRHPRHGLVPPDRFIPHAEETGLIVPIGRWVLAEACRQVAEWTADQPERPPLYLSVNVSGRQVADESLMEDVAAALRASGLDPGRLILEITESVLTQYAGKARDRLDEIRSLGVRFAIDDFGTGYSSLSVLQHLPVDVLKIDKSFVDAIDDCSADAALVTAVLGLGHAMGLHVVAEGIETADQVAALIRLRCRLGQGYHFARPLAPERIPPLLATSLPLQLEAQGIPG